MKAITIRLTDKLHKKMRLYLVENEKSAQEFIVSLIKKEIHYNEPDDEASEILIK